MTSQLQKIESTDLGNGTTYRFTLRDGTKHRIRVDKNKMYTYGTALTDQQVRAFVQLARECKQPTHIEATVEGDVWWEELYSCTDSSGS